MRDHRSLSAVVALAALIGSLVATIPAAVQAAETPRRGGILLAAIAADAPTLDPHQEQTFATIQMVAPLYSTLLQIDPLSYPKVIGDAATEWKIAPGGLTYTFKIRGGIRFHDGSPLTAADVKATYDKIVFPPEGVRSIRKNAYTSIASIEAPDPSTVVFKVKFPSASLFANLASPWNVIYPKKYLDRLFARQTRALDPSERKRLVNEIERIVLENAYYIPGLWWARTVVHWAKVKNYVAPPNHYSNQKLQDVWLSEE